MHCTQTQELIRWGSIRVFSLPLRASSPPSGSDDPSDWALGRCFELLRAKTVLSRVDSAWWEHQGYNPEKNKSKRTEIISFVICLPCRNVYSKKENFRENKNLYINTYIVSRETAKVVEQLFSNGVLCRVAVRAITTSVGEKSETVG